MYDPSLDANPIKKGKEVVYRYDGHKCDDKVTDPRKSADFKNRKKRREWFTKTLGTLHYPVSPTFPRLAHLNGLTCFGRALR